MAAPELSLLIRMDLTHYMVTEKVKTLSKDTQTLLLNSSNSHQPISLTAYSPEVSENIELNSFFQNTPQRNEWSLSQILAALEQIHPSLEVDLCYFVVKKKSLYSCSQSYHQNIPWQQRINPIPPKTEGYLTEDSHLTWKTKKMCFLTIKDFIFECLIIFFSVFAY